MDLSWLERTELLIGKESLVKLSKSKVLIVGLGGVGSFAAEFIARAGIGNMTIIDGDIVDVTNKNRQLPALSSTVGLKKADLMAARIEFEREWLPKFKNSVESPKKNFTLDTSTKSNTKPAINKQQKALSTLKSEGLKNLLDSI